MNTETDIIKKIAQIDAFIASDSWIQGHLSEFVGSERLWASVLFHFSPPELTGHLLNGREFDFLVKNNHLTNYILLKSKDDIPFRLEQNDMLCIDALLKRVDLKSLENKLDSFIHNIVINPCPEKYHFIKLILHPDLRVNSFRGDEKDYGRGDFCD